MVETAATDRPTIASRGRRPRRGAFELGDPRMFNIEQTSPHGSASLMRCLEFFLAAPAEPLTSQNRCRMSARLASSVQTSR
jgi:hypothetical protein